jgi:tetratricopeptide (TPR) repeat protein
MPIPATSELPKPLSWDEFEDIVWNIYKRKWNDPDAEKYGRTGQAQQGVDVYGRPSDLGGAYVGIQCKRYDNLEINTVREEIDKAEKFEPPLASLIIATTDKRDAKLQKEVRLINEKRDKAEKPEEKFPVYLVFWDDLSNDLSDLNNADLLAKYYGEWIGLFRRVLESSDYEYRPIKLHAPLRKVFDPLIEDRMKLFGGRRRVLTEIANYVQDPQGGYLVITAPPGFGKTALMASLVKSTPEAIAYHFFTPLYGDDCLDETSFLSNVVQQMAEWHGYKDELPDRPNELRSLYQSFIREPLGSTQILVLDGLDEVTGWKLSPYLSRELPEKLKIILTIRDVGQNWMEEYSLQIKQVRHLPLDGLEKEDVADILQAAGQRTKTFADNPALLAQVTRVASYRPDESLGADPFYVRLLAEDIAAGVITRENLSSQPKGLENYLKKWWEQVKQMAGDQPAKDLFGTLTVALGPIFRADLEAINPSLIDDWSEDRFDEVLKNVRRFIAGNDKQGYALAHPRLTNYMRTRIKTRSYTDKVLGYCAKWQQHRSPYVLRHYVEHLKEAGHQETLYNLISNEWRLAKLAKFHSHYSFAQDVDLAIQAASHEERLNVVQLIRCCLIYATLGALATDVRPEALGILAQCGQAEKALGYAALIQDASKKASAFMMIGEAMIEKGETEEAKDLLFEALEEVEKKRNRIGFLDLQKKIIWTLTKAGAVEQALEAAEAVEDDLAKADLVCKAVSATTQVGQINSVYRAMAIAEGVKDDLAKYHMLHCLATAITRSEEKDILLRVLAAAKSIKDKFWRANTLTFVSRAMIEMEEKDEAINVAYQALAVVDVIEEDSKKSSALSSITRTLAGVRDKDGLTGALAIATAIENKPAKAAALIDVGIALAQLGEHNQSEAAKEEAVVAALEAEDTVRALSYVAGQLIGGGDMVRAADSLNMILAAVKEIQNPVNKLDALLMLVRSWVIIGDKDRAAKLASRALAEIEAIGDELNKSRRLPHMVQALVRTGQNEDLNRAVAIAAELKNKHGQAQALSGVAQVLASNQKFDQASVVVMRINDPLERANALVQMAQVLAQTKQTLPAIESNKQALASLETIDDATVKSSTKVSVQVRIAWLFAQVGEIETAAGIVNQILDSAEAAGQAKSDSYRPKGVAKALAKAKRFNKAIEVTDSIGGELYRMEAMARVAQGLAEIGEQQRVKEVSEQILEIVDNLDNGPAKAEVLIELASALAQVGEKDLAIGVASQAVVVAENMLEDLINNHPVNQKGLILVEITLENVINFLAKLEETQKALELANKVYAISNELVGTRPTGGALVFLAKALILTGNKNRAAEYLDKAIISAEEKEEGLNKYSEFASIAQVHMQLGEISKATDLASDVILAAGKISDELLGPRSIGQAASILVYADKLEQALVVLDKIQGYSSKEIVLDYIIRGLIQKGDFDKAAELDKESYGMVERIDDKYEKSLKLKRLAQRMALANRQEQALQFLLSAFLTARFAGRSTVLDMLDGGAEILAEIDKGTTLWRSFEAVKEVDSWWGTE